MDYFDSAQQGNDAVKAAMLEAIRTQGSQAKQAFDAAQANIAQQRQAAVAAALADATKAGAPQAMLDQVSQKVGTPYDQRSADLSSAAASRQSAFDQIGASGGKYFDEASAALPVLRTQQAGRTATLQEQLQEKLVAAQQAAQDRALSHAVTMARLQKTSKPPSPSEIIANLGGPEAAGAQINDAIAQGRSDERQRATNDTTMSQAIDGNDNLPEQLASGLGLTPGLVRYLGQAAAAKQAATGASAAALQSDPRYGQAVSDFLSGAKQVGTTPKGAKSVLTAPDVFAALSEHYGPDVARQVIRDYGRALPSGSSIIVGP
jgi:hypothetical protein